MKLNILYAGPSPRHASVEGPESYFVFKVSQHNPAVSTLPVIMRRKVLDSPELISDFEVFTV
jgi:hypothetical protein